MYNRSEREPPCLDVLARWNSTLEMYEDAIKVKNILHTLLELHKEELPNDDDWYHIQGMVDWFGKSTPLSHLLALLIIGY